MRRQNWVSLFTPRVRGNRGLVGEAVSALGSIPACAGESPRCGQRWRLAEVYPRVCGGIICMVNNAGYFCRERQLLLQSFLPDYFLLL